MFETQLVDWCDRARQFETAINKVAVGLLRPVRLITVSAFVRGHAMLEGNVGRGKTTSLRAVPTVSARHTDAAKVASI